MLLIILRALFILILGGVAAQVAAIEGAPLRAELRFALVMILGLSIVLIDWLIPRKRVQSISAIYFGLIVGLILSNLLQTAISPLLESIQTKSGIDKGILLFLTVVICYACVSVLLQTKDDFRFVIPYVEFAREVKGPRPLILDTSVVIDGRIADVAETRILDQPLVVPRFVLQELQGVADSSDKLRRNRGRRGLDVLSKLQKMTGIEVRIHEAELAELQGVREVDQRLVILAKHLGGKVVTNDYNLNKIAKLQGVEVINLNDLANALKPIVLPGENLLVKLIKRGEEAGQGVGYLDDGTMVVIEQGSNRLGESVRVVVTSVLQTSAGRMIFGRVEGNGPPARGSGGSGAHNAHPGSGTSPAITG